MVETVLHTKEFPDFRDKGFSRVGNIVRMEGRIIVTFLPWDSVYFKESPRFIFKYENRFLDIAKREMECKDEEDE